MNLKSRVGLLVLMISGLANAAGEEPSTLSFLATAEPFPETSKLDSSSQENLDKDWQDSVSLFNGRDLIGWEVYLGVPVEGTGSIGRNVFQVVEIDGESAIRISGEIFVGLATLQEFGNYHLELEFKWGEQRFAPRADLPRDSGLLYHGSGGPNSRTGWLESLEFGILEGGETGD